MPAGGEKINRFSYVSVKKFNTPMLFFLFDKKWT